MVMLADIKKRVIEEREVKVSWKPLTHRDDGTLIRRKYGNVRVLWVETGLTFDSKSEGWYAVWLACRLIAGEIQDWKLKPRIKLMANGHWWCTYVPDFAVHHLDGRVELVDTKGYETPEYKLKKKYLELTYLPEHPECFFTPEHFDNPKIPKTKSRRR